MELSSQLKGNEAERRGCLVLLRHGETEWSKSGQYTGRTDLPLVEAGIEQARAVGRRLAKDISGGFDEGCIFVSPLYRAQQTAHFAGFTGLTVLNELTEWDYGRAEGRRPKDVVQAVGWDWDLWQNGPTVLGKQLGGRRLAPLPSGGVVSVPDGDGESLSDVVRRATNVVQVMHPLVESGRKVLLVAHAHILRIIAAQWLALDAIQAQRFRLDTAHYGVLSRYQGENVLKCWNC